MALLIDGYNLLHASGVFGRGRGPGSLERSREALLRFLAAALTPSECAKTTIVFDAAAAPYNLPRELTREGIAVRFAPRDLKADDVIEELIRSDSAPRRLTVVSSDHRVQLAARRRRAVAVDSDLWWAELVRRRREQGDATGAGPAKPEGPLTATEVEFWIREFASDGEAGEGGAPGNSDAGRPALPSGDAGLLPKSKRSLENPFPPGYAEDIQEEDV